MPAYSKSTPPIQLGEAESELRHLYRRRLALIQLIRSVEEYVLVAAARDPFVVEEQRILGAGSSPGKKPNLSVLQRRPEKGLTG